MILPMQNICIPCDLRPMARLLSCYAYKPIREVAEADFIATAAFSSMVVTAR